ncbi:MerR family transcriptional regulator [Asaia krungthepensis]|uniref:MerR family transcriptional regulator n=1 Tax=Asaia krungthepensis NRIC 0535 TaxID=1307925 RepID=A0ABQ0Q5I4_9PROT|nr:MerR family transcriptional regulator [Asaia krungthepensis]GBQ92406.1 MerR family transcriptional regulator [Asaia krungthepensis NRIC 0535]
MRDRSIGEMATQCGLSIRSLRHLEEKGLIVPRRSEAGRRVYGADDVALITKIMVLKQSGYRLSEISAAMLEPSLDSRSLIDTQIQHLTAKQREIAAMLRRLHQTRDLMENCAVPDVDGLCSLINEAQKIMTNQDYKDIAKRYSFSEEEWDRWQSVGAALFPDDARTTYEHSWESLIARVEHAVQRNIDPASAEAQNLLGEWLQLQQPMLDALGKEHWSKAASMYADMESWQTDTVKAPFSAAVYGFMTAAQKCRAEKAQAPCP